MAEYGEWTRKGAALSEVTAEKEYGVTRDFIVKGIQDGKLEYRDGAVWGNPYLRVLRSQLELYIVAQLGSEYLGREFTRTFGVTTHPCGLVARRLPGRRVVPGRLGWR
jgi:hypothetical protein